MKVVAKPIDIICYFDKNGVHPVRFRVEGLDEELLIIKIDKIIKVDMERFAGNKMLVFDCQSNMDGEMRTFQLKYELESCKWMLFKV